MPTIAINNHSIKKIDLPSSGQMIYWDDKLRGFGIRATPGALTYVVQRRINGKTVRHIVGRHGEITPSQAKTKAAAALADLRDGKDLNENKKWQKATLVTLAQAYQDFKNSRKLRPTTIQVYDGAIRRCFSDWQDKPITSISKDMIEKRHKKISNANGPRGMGGAHANQAMRTLRTILNYASATYEDSEGKSLLPENPVRRLSQVRLWNKIPRRQDIIQSDDLKDWYKSVMKLENKIVRDYLLLCLFTGLRRTEAMKLRWTNIDYTKTKTLTIPSEDTKTDDMHRLPLSDFLVTLLSERAKIRRIDNDYVFPSELVSGHIIEPKRVIANVVKDSGIKFSMHTLRRTFETVAERLDISYYSLKRLLNHKISNDVTSGYIVTSVERLREPMNKITDYLIGACGIEPIGENSKTIGKK